MTLLEGTIIRLWLGRRAKAAEWEYELQGNQRTELVWEAKSAALRATELQSGMAEGGNVLTSVLFFREWKLCAAARCSQPSTLGSSAPVVTWPLGLQRLVHPQRRLASEGGYAAPRTSDVMTAQPELRHGPVTRPSL
ncbi:MAG TPA: hypothetical protein VES20_06435 [Bryobacteraceae bacterium]|nr:hypothetical protein [Bryobacteraceae bacterium]